MWTPAFRQKCLVLALVVIGSSLLDGTTFNGASTTRAQDASATAPVAFGDVKAVLRKHCGTCHNANEMRGGLDVMSETAIQAGSDSGPVLVPGKPEESLLYLVTSHDADPKMPPNSPKIPQRELSILRRWIAGVSADAAKPSTNEGEENVAAMNAMSIASDDASRSSATSPEAATDSNHSSITALNPFASEVPIVASSLHPDAAMIALAINRQVVFLDKENRTFAGAIDFPFGEVHTLTYSQDGQKLIVGGGEPGASGGFVVYDRAAKPIFQWNEEFDVVQTLAVSPDNSLVAVGSPKRTVRVISLQDGSEKFVIKKHTDWLTALSFSPDGLLLASGDRFGGLYLWNVEAGTEFANLKEHTGTVRGIQFSPTSDHLISASEDGFLRRFDLQSLSLDKEWNCEVGGLTALTAASSLVGDLKEIQSKPLAERFAAGRVLVAGRNKKIKLYDFAANPLWEDSFAATVMPSLCMNNDATTIFGTTSTASVLSWLKDDHQLQPEIKLPISTDLNAKLIASIQSQKPAPPEATDTKIAAVSESMEPREASQSSLTISAPTSTIAESRKVLAETEDVLKRFSLITSQLEDELEKQDMLRTRDLLRTRIASHRRLMQSLNDYLVELSDTEELSDTDKAAVSAQLVQQLKSSVEKDLAELETKLAKVIESMTKIESMTDSEKR